MKRHTPAALAFAISLAAATTLMAQAPAADVDAVTSTPALPIQQAGSVQFVNGGAGDQERAAMKSLQSEFPLQIAFSGQGGEYGVADEVRVRGDKGPVVAVSKAGPLLMVKVPPGRYTVEADFNGKTQRRTVNASGHLVHWSSPLVSSN
jgi:hypothetical protein